MADIVCKIQCLLKQFTCLFHIILMVNLEGEIFFSFVEGENFYLHLQVRKLRPREAVTFSYFFVIFKKSPPEDMLIDFKERGREGQRQGEKHQCERET